MAVHARIKYYLSEEGRRDSLRRGGDGRRIQVVVGVIDDADLGAFKIDDEGKVSFDTADALVGLFDSSEIVVPVSKGQIVWVSEWVEEILWDVVPSWEDLLALARQKKARDDHYDECRSRNETRRARIAEDFLGDLSARATSVNNDSAVISDERFSKDHPVTLEARKRWTQDQEELKKINRAKLAEWVEQHGTDNQRQRLAACLLPWTEAHVAVEAYLFQPLDPFDPYKRFEANEVCLCEEVGQELCAPKFQSVDATELTAVEWDLFSLIKVAAKGAQFQLREHRAQCKSRTDVVVRRGVIVKFTLGHLTFKREFAL